ncbi:MAG: superoxide dismutase family protein [Elainellaceae cyanobacterium]
MFKPLIQLASVSVLVSAPVSIASLPVWAQAQESEPARATAILRDTEGNVVGNAIFTQTPEGVSIQAQFENLDAAVTGNERGQHGFHIHEVGECTAPMFESAGGHFNPTNVAHGLLDPDGPHAGDLINLWIEADGTADYDVVTDLITLGTGEHNILDADGSALIIHSEADDYHTDPSGASGDRIACGVIMAD